MAQKRNKLGDEEEGDPLLSASSTSTSNIWCGHYSDKFECGFLPFPPLQPSEGEILLLEEKEEARAIWNDTEKPLPPKFFKNVDESFGLNFQASASICQNQNNHAAASLHQQENISESDIATKMSGIGIGMEHPSLCPPPTYHGLINNNNYPPTYQYQQRGIMMPSVPSSSHCGMQPGGNGSLLTPPALSLSPPCAPLLKNPGYGYGGYNYYPPRHGLVGSFNTNGNGQRNISSSQQWLTTSSSSQGGRGGNGKKKFVGGIGNENVYYDGNHGYGDDGGQLMNLKWDRAGGGYGMGRGRREGEHGGLVPNPFRGKPFVPSNFHEGQRDATANNNNGIGPLVPLPPRGHGQRGNSKGKWGGGQTLDPQLPPPHLHLQSAEVAVEVSCWCKKGNGVHCSNYCLLRDFEKRYGKEPNTQKSQPAYYRKGKYRKSFGKDTTNGDMN